MRIVIAHDRRQLGQFVAESAAATLRTCLDAQATCNLVVATGSSQFEVLDSLVKQEGIDWSRVHGFHLDEYLGLSRSHSASFCGYLASRFVEKVPMGSFFFMDGTLPPDELLRKANDALAGRSIDLLLCGIGENGHLAFNDPPADFAATSSYLIVNLDQACRKQQVGEGWFDSLDEVPTQAISMSIFQIMQARRILCTVPDRRKAEAVKNTLEGPVTPDVPASILQQHRDVTLVLDTSSCSALSSNSFGDCEHLADGGG
jgi:glucosamine-6-phosphate deaminase